MNYVLEKLEQKENNEFKKYYKEIRHMFESDDSCKAFLLAFYDEFLSQNDNKRKTDKEFIKFARKEQEGFYAVFEMLRDIKEKVENSSLITFHIELNNYPGMYRVISVRSINTIDFIAYCTLAGFGLIEECDYVLSYEDKKFAPNYMVYEETLPDILDATEISIDELNFNVDDYLHFTYDDKWNFTIKVINIAKDADDDLVLEASEGYDLHFIDNEELKEAYEDIWERVEHEELTQDEFEERLDAVLCAYGVIDFEDYDEEDEELMDEYDDEFEEEFDDDEIDEEYLKKAEEKLKRYQEYHAENEKIRKLPTIKKYEGIKKLYIKVMDEIIEYLDDNREKYEKRLSAFFRSQKDISIKHLSIEKIEMDPTSQNNFHVSMALPLGGEYISPISDLLNENYFKKNKKDLAKSLLNTKHGIYRIISSDTSKGTVLFENMVTCEQIEVTDVNLAFSYKYADTDVYIPARIASHDEINFIISAEIINSDKELFDYIDKMQENYPDPLSMFIFVARIKNRQKMDF